MEWLFQDINESQLTKGFKCTQNTQKNYIRNWALKNHQDNVSKATVVLKDDGSLNVCAFYSVSAAQIAFDKLTTEEQSKLPGYPVPSVRIGQLAVDKRCARQGLGTLLMLHAFKKIVGVSSSLGIYAIVLDVEKDNSDAIGFYEALGFTKLFDDGSAKYYEYYIKLEDVIKTLIQLGQL
jgi:ribosomal protein S18 acetylase RimI-like enzyme